MYDISASQAFLIIETNSKSISRETSKRNSQKSSNVLKMNRNTFNIGTSTPDRRTSEN
ncbi:2889_t:CDS:2 [Funneliformis mosseae]|uniref:2889_t:CDS:1 n=1 Tax=Funneliformis mosseae TaxID=27381 RepID=A0A9N9FGV9_FUNMO|nr:2889_t:CDS:2 [Funneliformis mosseae]